MLLCCPKREARCGRVQAGYVYEAARSPFATGLGEILPDGNLHRVQRLEVLGANPSWRIRSPRANHWPGTTAYNANYNALSRYLKDFLRWLVLGATMQEVGKRLATLTLSLAEIRRTAQELIADSTVLCEASRMLCKRSEQERTVRRKQRIALALRL